MKFGVREICDVVLKAKAATTIGLSEFKANEPVLYFDSLKTSTLESDAATVYATGGQGNSKLIAWEGEKTVTFTMEDALLSPLGFSVLSGAGIVQATVGKPVTIHATTTVQGLTVTGGKVTVDLASFLGTATLHKDKTTIFGMLVDSKGQITTSLGNPDADPTTTSAIFTTTATGTVNVLVDYYVEKTSGAQQIEIEPGKFAGNYYLEASTLFRDTDGTDLPAEFVIPNIKIQSKFSFTMASSGDPSTFTFTADAFPDYTKFDTTKKVMFAIQIIA